MAESKFSMGDAVSFGWETMKSNILFFIGILIAMMAIEAVPSLIGDLLEEDYLIISIVFEIISIILNMAVGMGLVRILLIFCDGEQPEFADLFSCFHLVPKYFLSSLLYGLIVLAGFILLIVPGIIWAIKFQFFPYFIVEGGLGPIESLKRSSTITDGAKMDLFLFGLLLLGINIVGLLCLIIGLFVSIPVTMLALAYVYRTLLAQAEAPPLSEAVA
jgi:uncharacterized membrane protein